MTKDERLCRLVEKYTVAIAGGYQANEIVVNAEQIVDCAFILAKATMNRLYPSEELERQNWELTVDIERDIAVDD